MNNPTNTFTSEILQKIYKAIDELPPEAIERAPKEVTRKGYDTTGYQYQYLVNVINEVVGVNNWSNDFRIIKEIEGKWNTGKSFFEITIEMELTILGAKRKASGGHKSEMYFDAHKGAITNSIKKTLSLFSIGKKAFEGVLDEDYRPLPMNLPKNNFSGQNGANLKPQAISPATAPHIFGNCPECNSKLAVSKYNSSELYCVNYTAGCRFKKPIVLQKPVVVQKNEPLSEFPNDEVVTMDEIAF